MEYSVLKAVRQRRINLCFTIGIEKRFHPFESIIFTP